jgi:hypothetical protein
MKIATISTDASRFARFPPARRADGGGFIGGRGVRRFSVGYALYAAHTAGKRNRTQSNHRN